MQITTHYNSGMQKSISEHTTCQTSKWIGYSSRRPIHIKNKSNKYLIKCSLSACCGAIGPSPNMIAHSESCDKKFNFFYNWRKLVWICFSYFWVFCAVYLYVHDSTCPALFCTGVIHFHLKCIALSPTHYILSPFKKRNILDLVIPRHNQSLQFLNFDPWVTYDLPHHHPYRPWG